MPECKHENGTFIYGERLTRCWDCQADVPVDHDCYEHAVPYTSDGPLGHGYDCGRCGAFLQAG